MKFSGFIKSITLNGAVHYFWFCLELNFEWCSALRSSSSKVTYWDVFVPLPLETWRIYHNLENANANGKCFKIDFTLRKLNPTQIQCLTFLSLTLELSKFILILTVNKGGLFTKSPFYLAFTSKVNYFNSSSHANVLIKRGHVKSSRSKEADRCILIKCDIDNVQQSSCLQTYLESEYLRPNILSHGVFQGC